MALLRIRSLEVPEIRRSVYRAVRRARSLTAGEAADRIGVAKRTYDYFEGGAARFDLRRLELFATALEVDAQAILLSMMLQRPQFAVRAAPTHLVTVVMELCAELETSLGDDLARLDGPSIRRALAQGFDALATEAENRTYR